MNREFSELVALTDDKYSTCSLINFRDKCVTFLKNERYLEHLKRLDVDLFVIVPEDINISFEINKNVKLYRSKDVDLLFTLYQNHIHRFTDPSINDKIAYSVVIHPSSVIGVDGVKISMYEGRKILFKHTGNVVIEEGVDIGANVVIHRARLDSTVIGKGTIVGALTNVAHNVIIGKGCVFTACVSVGGSVKIGNNCWFGMGALVRNGVSICNNVVVGMGAVVVKDIDKPGFYVGNPAKFLKDFKQGERGF